jgi:hypothetical protein
MTRNAEYQIVFHTKNTEQFWFKEGGRWVQVSGRGVKRPVTAEQLLSHMLPALSGDNAAAHMTVERRSRSSGDAR